MSNLRDIKRRIGSVKSTQKITRAMKMVAASKLRKAQAAIVQARPYAEHMQKLAYRLAERSSGSPHPLLQAHDQGAVALLVVTSDRGLCGGFNASIVARVMQLIHDDYAGREVELHIIGRKGVEALRRRGCHIAATYQGRSEAEALELAREVADTLINRYRERQICAVHAVFNLFRSAVTQEVTVNRLLPLAVASHEGAETAASVDYLYEPSQELLVDSLLNRQISVQVHRLLFESAASEYGARMTAMDAATRNAGEVIKSLTLAYNRARQDAITTELIEVVSGAEAL